MSILVTGAAGFIGSNFVHLLMASTDEKIISLDALTYAGNLANLAGISSNQHVFVHGNICDQEQLNQVFNEHAIKKVVHFAAESHVDQAS